MKMFYSFTMREDKGLIIVKGDEQSSVYVHSI